MTGVLSTGTQTPIGSGAQGGGDRAPARAVCVTNDKLTTSVEQGPFPTDKTTSQKNLYRKKHINRPGNSDHLPGGGVTTSRRGWGWLGVMCGEGQLPRFPEKPE